jgi:hypothetical protein
MGLSNKFHHLIFAFDVFTPNSMDSFAPADDFANGHFFVLFSFHQSADREGQLAHKDCCLLAD